MTEISTHVLDTARGLPAAGVPVELQCRGADGEWSPLAAGTTDGDGRAGGLAGPAGATTGVHRLVFATAEYLSTVSPTAFFDEIVVSFAVANEERLHVPLLLSPFGYSVYKGS